MYDHGRPQTACCGVDDKAQNVGMEQPHLNCRIMRSIAPNVAELHERSINNTGPIAAALITLDIGCGGRFS